MLLGERIKKLRKEKRLTQEELGKLINVTKVSVSGYENGNRNPDTETLQKIADVFGVTTDFLLGRESHFVEILDGDQIKKQLTKKNNTDYTGLRTKLGMTKQEFLELQHGKVYINKNQANTLEKELGIVIKTLNVKQKDEKDIAKRMEQIKKDLTSEDGLMFNGEPMGEEAIESFLEAMEYAVRQTQRINKKYIPKKHRDNKDI